MDHQPSPASRALNTIEAILDGFDPAQAERGERFACAQRARRLASRLTAVAGVLLAKADVTQESQQDTGTPTSSWLAITAGMSKREAAGFLHQAHDLAAHPDVAQAATAGRISIGQARVIHTVLGGLDGLDQTQQAKAEELLLNLADTMDTDRLAKAAPQVLAHIAPQQAEDNLERRLQRQAEAAHRNRSLTFGRDGNGSVTFTGSLPLVEGETWMAFLDACTESQRHTPLDQRDPLAASPTPQQRRADALIAMITNHQHSRRAPNVAGDRPRIVVTLNYDTLTRDAAGAGLISTDEPISAADLRRLCCDAGLLPAVLGGPSQILDVGREQRLVTPDIRAALTLRDAGCIFPGCQTRPNACEAHHITPWWKGGPTALTNLCLLCHHHHGLVEPAKHTTRDQWEIHIATDGTPEAIPPQRCDPQRKPLRHAHFEAREALARSA